VSGIEAMEIRFALPARLQLLRPLSDFVRELLLMVRSTLTGATSDAVLLVLHEAFTNVCQHAYAGSEDGVVVVTLILTDDRLELLLEDQGSPFDEANWQAPDLDRPLESGRGVWLMKQLMNEFIYESTPGRSNVLRLVKYLGACS
jgi:anti-sigma regulatory factor (Ser/Thr protein kinase)